MRRYTDPQPILLPEVKPRRQALPATIIARPLPVASSFPLLYCPTCSAGIVERRDCFCGQCGTPLRQSF